MRLLNAVAVIWIECREEVHDGMEGLKTIFSCSIDGSISALK